MAVYHLLTLWLVCAGCLVLHSQQPGEPQGFTQRTWRNQDGFPDDVIQALAQTPDHFLWVGTSKGLLRFDGRNFTQFEGPGSSALDAQDILSLLVARDGSLWIGTDGGGLLHYAQGRIQVYAAGEGLTYPIIRALYQASDGAIWAGSDFGVFKQAGDRFTRADDPAKLVNFGAQSIIGDDGGSIWVGGTRLVRYQGDSYREYTMPKQSGSIRIRSLCRTADGTIWVGTVGGLYRGSQNGYFQRVNAVSGSIRILEKDPQGRLWVGTVGNGLYVQTDDGFRHLSAPAALPSNTVLSLLNDSEENIWVGTQAGLLRLSRTGMRLLPFPNVADSDFSSMFRDHDGTVWICSTHLFRIDHGGMKPYSFPGLKNVTVRTMLRDSSGVLWLGTMGAGACRIPSGGRMTCYQIGNNYVRGFLQTGDGSVWVATDGGVSRWKNDHFDLYHLIPGAVRMNVTALAGGSHGSLWIGTPHGLRFFRGDQFPHHPLMDWLKGRSVWSLHADADGTLWIGTNSGLYRWKDDVLRHVPLDAVWGTQAVYSILQDSFHEIWISGPTTVLRIKRKDLDNLAGGDPAPVQGMKVFSVSSDLQSAELYGGMLPSGVLDQSGGAWFPTSQGALHINPKLDRDAPVLPPLVINQVLADGSAIDFKNGIDLPSGIRTLVITYSPVLLSSQAGLRFQRMLDGFDTNWDTATSERTSVYTNLRAGHYTWRLRAFYPSNPLGVSSLMLPVKKEAHFYQTIWFALLCILFAGVLAWLIERVRSRYLQSRFRAVMQERSRMAREIHDSVIQGCTGVSVLLEAYSALPKNQPVAQDQLIDSARVQIKTTIDGARDAVWDLRHLDLNSRAFPEAVRAHVEKLVRDADVEFEFSLAGDEQPLTQAVAREALMVVREAVRNALQHGHPTTIRLALRYQPGYLSISVFDNGRGFESGDLLGGDQRHFGLVGIQERVHSVKGTVSLRSDKGNGTSISFSFPLDYLDIELRKSTPMDVTST